MERVRPMQRKSQYQTVTERVVGRGYTRPPEPGTERLSKLSFWKAWDICLQAPVCHWLGVARGYKLSHTSPWTLCVGDGYCIAPPSWKSPEGRKLERN